MTYREQQRERAIKSRNDLFSDIGGGIYKGKTRDFVLKDPDKNLWDVIREDVIKYFKENDIAFWESKEGPTGHLLSSQVACLNHLYPIRKKEDVATAVLKAIHQTIKKALKLQNDGFVEFEEIGSDNYLHEKKHQRGANSTSIDAMMLGERSDGKKVLLGIEWKYTEFYNGKSKLEGDSGKTRNKIYSPLLEDINSPIMTSDRKGLFTEPYYQMMRQTLLLHEMVKAKEYGAEDYLHVHVIPDENKDLKDKNPAAMLPGKTMAEAWRNCLKDDKKYISISPEKLFALVKECPNTQLHLEYLGKRYWH